MSTTQEIPAEIMQEARRCYDKLGAGSIADREYIARALLARDTAARKERAEIARAEERQRRTNMDECAAGSRAWGVVPEDAMMAQGHKAITAGSIAAAIEATIGGGNE